jgi:hypothetical protein
VPSSALLLLLQELLLLLPDLASLLPSLHPRTLAVLGADTQGVAQKLVGHMQAGQQRAAGLNFTTAQATALHAAAL